MVLMLRNRDKRLLSNSFRSGSNPIGLIPNFYITLTSVCKLTSLKKSWPDGDSPLRTIQIIPYCIYNVRIFSENDKNNSCHSIYFFFRYLHWNRLNSCSMTHTAALTWYERYFASSFVFIQLTIIKNSIDRKNMLSDIWIHYTFEKVWTWNNVNHFCTGSMSIKLWNEKIQ